jgi:hypothetical protein
MRKNNYFVFILTFLVLISNSCNNTDLTPTYLEISEEAIANPVNMTNYNLLHDVSYDSHQLAAVASHKFSDVWVYANGEKIGLWEVPCKIPILESDSILIQIVPGVRMNGMSTTIPAYPFLQPYKETIYIEKGETYSLDEHPISFKYYDNVVFPLLETFEQSTTFTSSIDDGGEFVISHEDGENVGLITLEDSLYGFEVESPSMTLPGNNNSIFFEMDYKCDQEMSVGLVMVNSSGISEHEPLVNIRTTNGEWKKIYINLTQSISRNADSDGYVDDAKLVISGSREDDLTSAKFYFDNAKIIYIITQ